MITHIHHINFIVKDLEAAIKKFEILLGTQAFELGALEQRAVKTAKVKLGDTWLVLVQPTDPNSIPGKYLAAHGEGFFLISLGTDDLESQLRTLAENGITPSSEQRRGLDNWQVTDLPTEAFYGEQVQLCQELDA